MLHNGTLYHISYNSHPDCQRVKMQLVKGLGIEDSGLWRICPKEYRHLLRDERRHELKKQYFNKRYISKVCTQYLKFFTWQYLHYIQYIHLTKTDRSLNSFVNHCQSLCPFRPGLKCLSIWDHRLNQSALVHLFCGHIVALFGVSPLW